MEQCLSWCLLLLNPPCQYQKELSLLYLFFQPLNDWLKSGSESSEKNLEKSVYKETQITYWTRQTLC